MGAESKAVRSLKEGREVIGVSLPEGLGKKTQLESCKLFSGSD